MKQTSDITDKVAELVAISTKIEIGRDQYEQALHLDSLGILEVMIALENTFGVEVDEDEIDLLETFQSVSSIAQFVELNTAEEVWQ